MSWNERFIMNIVYNEISPASYVDLVVEMDETSGK